MNGIRAGLRAMAEEAPRGILPEDFYARTRATHRGRKTAALATVVVVLLVTAAGWAVRTGGHAAQPAQGGTGIPARLPLPPWYTGGSNGIGITAAIYGGPATTGEWQEGRFAALSADGERCRVFNGSVYTPPGFEALLSPDGTRIAREGTVTSLVTGKRTTLPGEVRAFSPDGTLVVYQDGSTVGVRDLARPADTARIDVGPSWLVPGFAAAVAPGNDRVALMLDRRIMVYDLRTGRLLYLVHAGGDALTGPGAWLPDGSAFAMAVHVKADEWRLVLRRGEDGAELTDRPFARVTGARYLRLLGWHPDGTALAVAGVPVAGSMTLENSWGTRWGPYSDVGSSAARVLEIRPDGSRELLRTPAGIPDLDVAVDLAGAFLPPGDPGFGARSNPIVYLGSMCLFVGGAMIAAVVVRRRRRPGGSR